ncbi:MAG: hypothetical protein QM597_06680 [Aeromicrobium sp.]|uniref:hypothetical protein n=1 Tax=Aeromicrobium sp. TaxID=1871063 RepID=UPI0039E4EEEA
MSQNLTAEERAAELASLDRVRRRVLAIGFFTVVIHGVLGLIGGAHVIHGEGRTSGAVVLLVMSGIVALLMVGIIRVILKRSPFAPLWFLVGLIPTAVGVTWVLG